jgi:ribosome-binding protein aMBF1 (putative translation factor)
MDQDWKPVVWSKKAPTKANQVNGRSGYKVATQAKGSAEGQRMSKIARTEIGSLTKVSSSVSKAIISARIKKKMTQKEFATACSLPLTTINGYESKKAQPKQSEIIKMQRVLGIHLTGKNVGTPL